MKFGTWAHYIISYHHFKCSVTQAKSPFIVPVNTIFGKVGRIASEEVILHLVKIKCLPILLYGLECYLLIRLTQDLSILQSHVFLMKMFSVNLDVINECRLYFDFMLPSKLPVKWRSNFLRKFNDCSSIVCHFGFGKCVKCVRQLSIFIS